MRIEVDLVTCRDHGQCVFAAPAVFALDDDGLLALRADAHGERYVCREIDESLREDVEEAADLCPVQAIAVRD